mgnify:CR=1 FL=1
MALRTYLGIDLFQTPVLGHGCSPFQCPSLVI